jgi:MFS family permease
MTELIVFRAIQGLGGGGLFVTTFAVIGDIIPPRDRGRYQGFFGGVFGVSTVIGPLLGGFFVDNLSWRWIFYVNVPIGLIALAVIATAFQAPRDQVEHTIDYLGAVLLAGGLSAIVLYTSLGGTTYAWDAPQMVAMLVAGFALLAGFVFVESRAAEPILPLEIFRNRVFSVTSAIGFIIGLAFFGAITYLPLYLQDVKGHSPTTSGLLITPMMAGLLITSIGSGQLISRFGRYKPFPIAGTAIIAVGLWLLSRLHVDTSTLVASVYMIVLGLGLGMVLQVLVLAAQNAVDYKYLGVRDVRIDALPADRGVDRRHDLRGDLRQSAREQPRSEAAGRRGRPRLTESRSAQTTAGRTSRRLCQCHRRRAPTGVPCRVGSGGGGLRPDLALTRGAAAIDDSSARCRQWLPRSTRRQRTPRDRARALAARGT